MLSNHPEPTFSGRIQTAAHQCRRLFDASSIGPYHKVSRIREGVYLVFNRVETRLIVGRQFKEVLRSPLTEALDEHPLWEEQAPDSVPKRDVDLGVRHS